MRIPDSGNNKDLKIVWDFEQTKFIWILLEKGLNPQMSILHKVFSGNPNNKGGNNGSIFSARFIQTLNANSFGPVTNFANSDTGRVD